jgi:hypothetical protein
LKPARHTPGSLRAFSRIDESACNPKPKNLRQGERNPFNVVHDDLANYRALQQYVVHYHGERNHQGKENLILFPLKAEGARNRQAAVRCRERLGGLLKYYEREAA